MWGIREKWRGWQFFFFFFGQTCFEPAVVGERLPGLQRFVPVLLEDRRPSDQELALSPRKPGSNLRPSDTRREPGWDRGGSMNLSATPQFQEDDARSTECDATVPSRTGRLFHRNTFIWTAALTRTSVLYLDNQNPRVRRKCLHPSFLVTAYYSPQAPVMFIFSTGERSNFEMQGKWGGLWAEARLLPTTCGSAVALRAKRRPWPCWPLT